MPVALTTEPIRKRGSNAPTHAKPSGTVAADALVGGAAVDELGPVAQGQSDLGSRMVEVMMDMAEGEADEASDDSLGELEHTYGDEGCAGGGTHDDNVIVVESALDAATVALVSEGLGDCVDIVGLGDDQDAGQSAGSSSSSGLGSAAGPAVPPPAPWQGLSEPAATGYVYDNMRSVMRIQRGKPKNSVTITCYRHSKCNFLLTMARCPDNQALFKWFYEVEAAPSGSAANISRELGAKHVKLAMSRWSAKGQAAASS